MAISYRLPGCFLLVNTTDNSVVIITDGAKNYGVSIANDVASRYYLNRINTGNNIVLISTFPDTSFDHLIYYIQSRAFIQPNYIITYISKEDLINLLGRGIIES